jgi:hypothetical protein
LNRHNIDYCVIGGNALSAHGFERQTEDIDVLVRKGDLEKFQNLLGLGYVRRFPHATTKFTLKKGYDVPIDVIEEGEIPGHGCPVPFPSPQGKNSFSWAGVKMASLPLLVTLKLASALTNKRRTNKDEEDVIQLILRTHCGEELIPQLDPFVVERYRELLDVAKARQDEPN